MNCWTLGKPIALSVTPNGFFPTSKTGAVASRHDNDLFDDSFLEKVGTSQRICYFPLRRVIDSESQARFQAMAVDGEMEKVPMKRPSK